MLHVNGVIGKELPNAEQIPLVPALPGVDEPRRGNIELVSYTQCSELAPLKDAWDRLAYDELQFVPSFAKLQHSLETSDRKFRLITAVDETGIIAIACFVYFDNVKRYEIALRKLFDFRVKEALLYGSCVLGNPGEDIVRSMIERAGESADLDVISVGEILIESSLYRAIATMEKFIAWRIMRNRQRHWLIELPRSFDDYLSSLGPETRKSAKRYRRKLETAGAKLHIVHRAEDVPGFLRDAEKVSRLTYQWSFGQGVCNDEMTRERLTSIANRGNLRSYLLYLNGEPCAFGWGELCHGTFGFHYTGYDPQHRHLSPGANLIMQVIRDLIENTDCEIVDFGSGSEDGYKSRLATLSLSCARMQIAPAYRPYSLFLVAADKTLILAKNSLMRLVEAIAGRGAIKQRLKSALRPFGIAMY